MSPQFWPRLGGTFALGLAALVAERAPAAEPPAPLPVLPAVHTEPVAPPQPQPEIERFHGTVRVGPMTPPVPPAPAMRPPAVEMVPPLEPPVVQVEARTPVPVTPAPVVPETRVTDAVVDTLATVRDDTRRVSTAAAVLLGQVGNWMKAPPPHPEPRAIFPITVTVPAPQAPQHPAYYPQVPPWAVAVPGSLPSFPPHAVAPVSAAVPQPAAPLQPTIIVVREPAPVVAAPAQVVAAPVGPVPVEPTRTGFATESLLGFGVGALGLGVGLMGWLRTGRKKQAEAAAAALELPSPAHRPVDGVVLSNGLYAGPRPDLAEKFDLGPSYHDEQEQKKQQEAENQTAVLEFILTQNLALQAAFADNDAPAAAAAE